MDISAFQSIEDLENRLQSPEYSAVTLLNELLQPAATSAGSHKQSIIESQAASVKIMANLDAWCLNVARELNNQLLKLEKYEQKLDHRVALAVNDVNGLKSAQELATRQIATALSQPELVETVSGVLDLAQRQKRLREVQAIMERAAQLDEAHEIAWLQQKVLQKDLEGFQSRMGELERLGRIFLGTNRQQSYDQFLVKAKALASNFD